MMDIEETDIVANALKGFAFEVSGTDVQINSDVIASIVEWIQQATVTKVESRIIYPESDPDVMQMMIVRHQWRTAKSIRLNNVKLDTSLAGQVAMNALIVSLGIPVVTAINWSILATAAGLAFAVYRIFGKAVRWEDACLLHALNKEANFNGIVAKDVAEGMGTTLESIYGYKKALNSNEVVDILDRLVAWRALQQVPEGFKVLESVVFSKGLWLNKEPD